MNRDEHLAWCKRRAFEYVEIGDVQGAITSLMSDLTKHDETMPSQRQMRLSMAVQLANSPDAAREFIRGIR